MGNLLSLPNRSFMEKLRAVETRAAKYQKEHGLSSEDMDAFQRIAWKFSVAFVRHMFLCGLLGFYVGADLDPRRFRYPLQHTVVSFTRRLRFFPNIHNNFLRTVVWAIVPIVYFPTVAYVDYAKVQMKEKVKLDTDFGREYRRAIYQVDPENVILRKYAPSRDYDLPDSEAYYWGGSPRPQQGVKGRTTSNEKEGDDMEDIDPWDTESVQSNQRRRTRGRVPRREPLSHRRYSTADNDDDDRMGPMG